MNYKFLKSYFMAFTLITTLSSTIFCAYGSSNDEQISNQPYCSHLVKPETFKVESEHLTNLSNKQDKKPLTKHKNSYKCIFDLLPENVQIKSLATILPTIVEVDESQKK